MRREDPLGQEGFVDIHVHILPGLDDGAASWNEAIQMARQAWREGIRKLVATPHNYGFRAKLTKELVLSLVEELRKRLEEEGLQIELYPGVEVMLMPDIFHFLEAGTAFTLNSSRYILVELPLFSYPVYTEEVLFRLQVKGYKPILAHPERNTVFQERPELLYSLVKRGILVQLTSGSITGELGGIPYHVSHLFLRHRWAHIIASDAHSPMWRPPFIKDAVEEAAKIVGEEKAKAMVTSVPEAILNDEEIEVEEPLEYKPRRGD
ncbi:MAG: phosphotransferase [Chloroflexi bacterium]|nr:MAG: phosphotransferase [Chloroflexota bacterium]HDN79824.1 phosphotransferase [Chloroflexota bacterium]